MKRFRFAILAALLACTAQARTLYVSTTGSHKYGSATDATTNANHGRIVGGVTSAEDSPFAGESSAAFDGTTGYIGFGNPASLDMSAQTNITIEFWIWMNNTNGFQSVYESGTDYEKTYLSVYTRHLSDTNGFSVRFNWGGNRKALLFGDATATATGKWIHVAAVRSGTNLWAMTNGVEAAWSLGSYAQTPTYANARAGYNSSLSPGYLNGRLSDLRIWNVARTPEQIAENYTNRLTGTEEGLVGYWPLKDPAINPIDTGPFNLDNPIIHPSYHEAF